jgi:serine protease Do
MGLLLVMAVFSPAVRGQQPDTTDEDAAGRARRRSPVVEVYEACQAAVVFITFPVPKGGNSAVNEFFVVPGVREEVGAASGFAIHESGYIITSAHAVSSIAMQAQLSDGRSYPVDVVCVDRGLDVAVVRVWADRPLRTLSLARGTDTMIGETVVVIGNPHGLRQSCVTGVVSALGRQVTAQGRTFKNLLQHSAGTNPGNSGGPVLNILGEVLAVASITKTDAASLSFAVPADAVRKALPRLLDVERRQGIVTGLTFADDGSARVAAVADGSPADNVGVRAGDMLGRAGSRRVLSESDFHLELLGHGPGGVVPLELARDGRVVRVALTLGKRTRPDARKLLTRLGLKAAPLDRKRAAAMHLRQPKGLLVTDVQPGVYPLAQRPEPGDVLARINDTRPEDMDHVGRLLAEVPPGQTVRLVFLRQRENTVTRMDVTVTPGSR